MTPRRWLLAYLALLLLALWPWPAHATVEALATDYKFVNLAARGASSANTGADTSHCWTLTKANQTCIPGRTFVIMPGDYHLEASSSDIGSCVDPQAAGTGLSPDSSVRYVSYDFYSSRDVSNPRNFFLRGTELNKSYCMVTGISTYREASCNRQTSLVGAQWDSLSYCRLTGLGIYGVNTVIAYRDTIYKANVGYGYDLYAIGYGGESSSCLRSCSYQSQNGVIRRCVVIADTVRQGARMVKLEGRSTSLTMDSCKTSGLFCMKQALGDLTDVAAMLWFESQDGAYLHDNTWSYDMRNGLDCVNCNSGENTAAASMFYMRDSTNHVLVQRDTFNLGLSQMCVNCGVEGHWSASGHNVGPNNHIGWENCVFRGRLSQHSGKGFDFQYSADHYNIIGNSFFADSGGSPLQMRSTVGGGVKIERNTVVTRQSPTITYDGTATANPSERNTVLGNVFVRMRTTAANAFGDNTGAVAWMSAPLAATNAFEINRNLYYSYTGAVSQGMGWPSAPNGGCPSLSFLPQCLDSCPGSSRCWPSQGTNGYDALSRWGNPLLIDTTSALFGGNIACYSATGVSSAAFSILGGDSAVGARQPQGKDTYPREPYAYATDSLSRQVVIDTLFTTSSTIVFKFIAPPDNENTLVGQPNSYEIAVSDQPVTAENFGSLTHVQPPSVKAPGTIVSFTVDASVMSQVYYVAVRTLGSCGILSRTISDNGCAVPRGSLVLCP